MSKIQTVEQLCRAIWKLEQDFDLLDQPFCQVKVWQLLRMVIYYKLAQATGVFNQPHTEKKGLLDIVKTAPQLIGLVTRDPLRGDHERDVLVFDHMRKVRADDGRFVDIYSQPLVDSLAPGSYEVMEQIYLGKHLTHAGPEVKYLDGLAAGSFIYSRLTSVSYSEDELSLIAQVEQALEQETGVSLNLGALFAAEIKHFRFAFSYYTRLLKKRRPRKIFLVVSYSFYKRPLIAAAKALHIETIELQHGTISPFHLGYNFPGRKKELDYFPSTFYSFGDYWNTAAEYPLPQERIKTWGFPHFVQQRAKYDLAERRTGQFLFISQGVIGKRLATFALACAQAMPDNRIIYKLHPGEYDRWQEEYPDLVAAERLPNVQVVDHNERNLHEYMAQSEFQVGVFSTAIYEGLAFDCRTFVVDLPGIEYMSDLIERRVVAKVSSVDDLQSALKRPPGRAFDNNFFFAPGPSGA